MRRDLENALYAALVLDVLGDVLDEVVPDPLTHQMLIYTVLGLLTGRKLRAAWLVRGRQRASTALVSARLLFASPPPSAAVLRPRPVV